MDQTATRLIKSRRSVRRYRPEPVPKGVIQDILDCARLAPTARNRQPWLIGAVTDRRLLGSLADMAENGRFIQQSAVCFAVFSRLAEKYYLEDGVAATMNILNAAEAHGLGACWIAGDKKEYAAPVRQLLGVPPEFTLVSLVAAGFPAQKPSPAKKPLAETTFLDRHTGSAENGS